MPAWLAITASRLLEGKPDGPSSTAEPATPSPPKPPAVRPALLVAAWVRMLTASACGHPVQGLLIGRDATLALSPVPGDQAIPALGALISAWHDGMQAPLPLACRTGLAWLQAPARAPDAYNGGYAGRAEVDDPCLARVYPDFAALAADGRFATLADALLAPLLRWVATGVQVVHAVPVAGVAPVVSAVSVASVVPDA